MHLNHWTLIFLTIAIFFFVFDWWSKRPLKTTEQKKDGKVLYRSLSPEDGWALIDGQRKVVLLDVRTPEEFAHSHFPTSINLPLNKLDHSANQKLGNRNKTILVYCQSGARSKQATKLLYALGFTDVYNIGGLNTFIKRKP